MTEKNPKSLDDQVLRTMSALVRMPPKHHDEMKLGNARGKSAKSPARKAGPGKSKAR